MIYLICLYPAHVRLASYNCRCFSWVMDKDQANLVGVTFDRWWVAIGVFLTILPANGNGVKYSTAVSTK